jgi:hypothetical protein
MEFRVQKRLWLNQNSNDQRGIGYRVWLVMAEKVFRPNFPSARLLKSGIFLYCVQRRSCSIGSYRFVCSFSVTSVWKEGCLNVAITSSIPPCSVDVQGTLYCPLDVFPGWGWYSILLFHVFITKCLMLGNA